jgi:hypothetical protein
VKDYPRWEFFGFGKIVKSPQRRDLQVKTFGTEPARGLVRFVLQGPVPLVFEKIHQIAQRDGLPILEAFFFRPGQKIAQQRRVSFSSLLRMSPFVAQINQKVLDQVLHQSLRPVRRS